MGVGLMERTAEQTAARDKLFERARMFQKDMAAKGRKAGSEIIRVVADDHIEMELVPVWNIPGKVKPGMFFKHRTTLLEVLVLGVHSDGYAEVLTLPDCVIKAIHCDALLQGVSSRPRLSLEELLDYVVRSLENPGSPVVFQCHWLASLFNGVTMPAFTDLPGMWAAVRAYYLQFCCGHAPALTLWARKWQEDGLELPSWLARLAESPATEEEQPWPGRGLDNDGLEAEFRECLAEIKDAVARVLARPLEPAGEHAGGDFGAMGDSGTYIVNGADVVILGKAAFEREAGYVDVVELDTTEIRTCHLSEIEPDSDRYDEEEVLEILNETDAGDARGTLCMIKLACWSAKNSGYERCLMLMAFYRTFHGEQRLAARHLLQEARKLYKDLEKGERSKASALAPELLTKKSEALPAPRGSVGAIMAYLREVASRDEAAEGIDANGGNGEVTPHAPPADIEAAQEIPPLSEPAPEPDQLVPPAPSPAEAPAPVPLGQTPTAPRGDAGGSTRRPLRFPSHEHRLIAMEWDLAPGTGEMAGKEFDTAVASTLGWLSDRLGTSLPREWGRGGHEIELSGVRIQIEADPSVFAVRMEHPDAEHQYRAWTVEATIIAGAGDSNGMVGVRVSAKDRVQADRPRAATPGLVDAWIKAPGLLVGGANVLVPTTIDSAEEFEVWDAAWRDRDAKYLVAVAPEWSCRSLPARLVANIRRFRMTGEAATLYSQRYGAVHDGQVHVFAPGAKGRADWALSDAKSVGRLIRLATDLRQRPDTPTFAKIRNLLRDAANRPRPAASAAEPEQTTSQMVEASAAEGNRLEEMQEMLDMALGDLDASRREVEEARAELAAMRAKVQGLQFQLQTKEPVSDAVQGYPEGLDGLAKWSSCLESRLVITDKALKAACRIAHQEPEKIFKSLEALAGDYWKSRFERDADAYARWNNFLTVNRLRWGPVGEAADLARYEGEYQAVWEGRSYTMSHHVAGSSSRDPTKAMRIYVAVDEERRMIVVGHLPTHLTNRQT